MSIPVPASIRVLMPNGQVTETKLETFLAGVVYAEMGATAPLEALKAQAVASRNYAASAHRHLEVEADVCTTAHCQEYKRVDPIIAPEVFRAVTETWGLVATHDGKLIEAFFFEHCDGHSRNAEDLLPSPFPYLQAVECGCGFLSRKGHGIGMCQRGAIVMAHRGASFVEILRHYYRDVAIVHTGLDESAVPLPPQSEVKAEESHKPVEPPAAVSVEPFSPPVIEVTAPVSPLVVLPPEPVRLPEPQLDFVEDVPALPDEPLSEDHGKEKPVTDATPVAASVQEQVSPSPEPSAPVESTTPPTSPTVPVPSYVEQLNIAASLSAQDIIRASAEPPALPAIEIPPQPIPPIHPSDLPALDEVIPYAPRRVHVDHLPGARMIAGCLESAGIIVSVEDVRGHKTLIFSGSAPHYGVGGFETVVDEDGRYVVTINDEQVLVDVAGDTAFIHLT